MMIARTVYSCHDGDVICDAITLNPMKELRVTGQLIGLNLTGVKIPAGTLVRVDIVDGHNVIFPIELAEI